LKEVQAIIARPQGTNVHDRVTVLLALLAGLRLGEVRGLRWEDIDLDEGILKVERSISADEKDPRDPKWGSKGELPISDPLAEELRALQSQTKDKTGYVLGIGGAPIGTTALRLAFRRVLEAVGIDAEARKARRLSFHGARHAFVSMGRLSGIPDFLMQKFARHKTASMTTQTYSHSGIIDYADARKRLTDSVKAKKAR
jgi:integrase